MRWNGHYTLPLDMMGKWDAAVNETKQKQLKYKRDWATMNVVRTTFFACFPFIHFVCTISLKTAQVWCKYCHWVLAFCSQKTTSIQKSSRFTSVSFSTQFNYTRSLVFLSNIFEQYNCIISTNVKLTQDTNFWKWNHCYHERCAACVTICVSANGDFCRAQLWNMNSLVQQNDE